LSGLQDGFSDLRMRKRVNRNGNVSGAVEREAALVTSSKVGLISEKGAGVFGSAATGERCRQCDFKMDKDRAGSGQEQQAGFSAFNGAAAQRQHNRIFGGEAGDSCMLQIAKESFSVVREDFSNRGSGIGFDHVIDVKKAPTEFAGDERADGRFPRSHKAGEDNATRLACSARFGLRV
jgi:hypothetical protein